MLRADAMMTQGGGSMLRGKGVYVMRNNGHFPCAVRRCHILMERYEMASRIAATSTAQRRQLISGPRQQLDDNQEQHLALEL